MARLRKLINISNKNEMSGEGREERGGGSGSANKMNVKFG